MKDESTAGLEPLAELQPLMGDTQLAPAHGIAAIALAMALKYHDISTVQDGTLYQQYKLEGKNMRELHIDEVFETAIRIEKHLVFSQERISKMLIDCITYVEGEDAKRAAGTPDAGDAVALVKCPRCGDAYEDGETPDGCEDPDCGTHK